MTLRCCVFLFALVLSGCAAYSSAGLNPGIATEADVRASMGTPAMQWVLPGGGTQLAFPHGPAGFQTYMVFIDAAGKLERTVNVLRQETFTKVQPGMTQAQVLQLLGPPEPRWEAYFKARDELVWEWRFCDSWNQAARFDVLFDGTTKIVRTAYSWQESQKSNYPISCGQSE
jgi:hypothetical protein